MSLPVLTGAIARPDANIQYWSVGDGPPLVFAHGLGGNALSWWQQMPHFMRRYRCIAFSHRGFAPSTVASGAPDPGDFADDLAALADRLGLDRFALVAQSMGGWTGVEFALRYPGRIDKLVLAATSGTFDPAKIDAHAHARWQEWADGERQRLAAANVHPATGMNLAINRPDLKFLYGGIDAMSPDLDKEKLRLRLHALRTRGPADIAHLDMPVLVACGELDPVFPSGVGPALAAACKRGHHIAFANAGHSAYFEKAAEFNRSVEAFLQL
jgi:pimeloyl-ACP methyl ester carboxylesterase